jgi:hypothetical protein
MKEGSIVPLGIALEPENGGENLKGFEVVIAIGADAFEILEERGPPEGHSARKIEWIKTPIRYTQATGILEVESTQGAAEDESHSRHWYLRFLGLPLDDDQTSHATLEIDGVVEILNDAAFSRLGNDMLVDLGTIPTNWAVTFELGQGNPQFYPTDSECLVKFLELIINNAQINYELKDAIWEIISTGNEISASAKMDPLLALDMNPNLRITISEYLASSN